MIFVSGIVYEVSTAVVRSVVATFGRLLSAKGLRRSCRVSGRCAPAFRTASWACSAGTFGDAPPSGWIGS